ncbi:MAG TPA: hypothetical protein VHS31_09260 [Tepidisphaeraceae bacterium]|jgi:hypothetical protein|nr:hypothetical protein [Tepidisphaeraceae bacterium]
MIDRLTRWLILLALLIIAIFLVSCAQDYRSPSGKKLSVLMCGTESILLLMTGAAIVARREETQD